MGKVIAIGNTGINITKDEINCAHIERVLNVEEAKDLFKREAVAFEYKNGVPTERAIELFTKDAIAFATRKELPQTVRAESIYGIGKIQMPYLTEYGFILAVTYHNIKTIHIEYNKRKHDKK